MAKVVVDCGDGDVNIDVLRFARRRISSMDVPDPDVLDSMIPKGPVKVDLIMVCARHVGLSDSRKPTSKKPSIFEEGTAATRKVQLQAF